VVSKSKSAFLHRVANCEQEHCVDGDVVNQNKPVAQIAAGPDAFSVWGPPVPGVF
jgi:hypothetical protein